MQGLEGHGDKLGFLSWCDGEQLEDSEKGSNAN